MSATTVELTIRTSTWDSGNPALTCKYCENKGTPLTFTNLRSRGPPADAYRDLLKQVLEVVIAHYEADKARTEKEHEKKEIEGVVEGHRGTIGGLGDSDVGFCKMVIEAHVRGSVVESSEKEKEPLAA